MNQKTPLFNNVAFSGADVFRAIELAANIRSSLSADVPFTVDSMGMFTEFLMEDQARSLLIAKVFAEHGGLHLFENENYDNDEENFEALLDVIKLLDQAHLKVCLNDVMMQTLFVIDRKQTLDFLLSLPESVQGEVMEIFYTQDEWQVALSAEIRESQETWDVEDYTKFRALLNKGIEYGDSTFDPNFVSEISMPFLGSNGAN